MIPNGMAVLSGVTEGPVLQPLDESCQVVTTTMSEPAAIAVEQVTDSGSPKAAAVSGKVFLPLTEVFNSPFGPVSHEYVGTLIATVLVYSSVLDMASFVLRCVGV